MQDPVGTIKIALGAIVLDTPDRSGNYVAKDLVGGWSYQITDDEGDYRYRGDGHCPGGLETALQWGLLAALGRAPDCAQIKVLVESKQAHQMLVRLAQKDELVVAGIERRPIKVLTRPEEKSVIRARNAAEQAASAALRAHARQDALQHAIAGAELQAMAARDVLEETAMDLRDWQASHTPMTKRAKAGPSSSRNLHHGATAGRLERLILPVTQGLRQSLRKQLAFASQIGLRRKRPANTALSSWMKEFEMQAAAVETGLESLGT
jgi:hypothetical protein